MQWTMAPCTMMALVNTVDCKTVKQASGFKKANVAFAFIFMLNKL